MEHADQNLEGVEKMNARISALVISLSFICTIAARAQTSVMNYNGQSLGAAPATFTQNGIRQQASVASGNLVFNLGNPTPGFALNTNDGGQATYDLVGGGSFNFVSIDLSAQFASNLNFLGTYAAGGTVSENYLTSNPSNVFATFTPTMNFTGLSSVKLTFPAGGGVLFIDNVTVAVPEPTTLALAAGAGAILMRRRRRSA